MRKGKIVVVAGNTIQFQHWLRQNIIPITRNDDVRRLEGVEIREVHYEGTYREWLSQKTADIINILMRKR